MNLPALLRTIFFRLITITLFTGNNGNGNGNTTTSSSPDSPPTQPTPTPTLLPRQPQGFTDPNLPSQPITFYETVSELILSNGKTYTSVYIEFVSGTDAYPVNLSPSTTTSKSESFAATKESTSTVISYITISSPTITAKPATTSSSTSPVLNLAPCSTFTAGVDDPALEGCINSVISVLSLTGGGPITASSTTSSSSSSSSSTIATTTAAAVITTVTPTRTVTLPYLGAVVAKGEATFVVGGGVEGKGGRVRGMGGGREVLVVVVIAVAVGMMAWWGG